MTAKVYEETWIRTWWPYVLDKYEVFAEGRRKSGQNNFILEGENTQFPLT